jgi:hypothetical protein
VRLSEYRRRQGVVINEDHDLAIRHRERGVSGVGQADSRLAHSASEVTVSLPAPQHLGGLISGTIVDDEHFDFVRVDNLSIKARQAPLK